MPETVDRIKTSCPRDCYDGCGIVVERRSGGELRVLGDADHPVSRGALCSKCAIAYNGVWQDEGARLLHPLRRTGPKGEGGFERIGWDEAVAEVAERLGAIVAESGAQAIVHSHYSGTLSILAYSFPIRFYNRLGSTEVSGDTNCNQAGHVAWRLLYGESNVGFDPRTARDSRCILVWGANPSHSAPHAHKHWLEDSPARVVVVDPIRSATAARSDLHLQPFPGSDAALAFSLLHVMRRDGLFDERYIAQHTLGADELQPALDACTPDWGEAQTGVPADSIERAAALYGEGPSLLWAGQGLCRQTTGGNVMRAVGLLPALTGNIGKPGAGFCFLNNTPGIAGLDWEAQEGARLSRGEAESISFMDFADRLGDPNASRAFVCTNSNPAASAPQQGRLSAALAREDLFTVAVDCFPTDTTRYADIVLPAASFLEFDDVTYSYFHLHIGAQSRVREPMGEALPNQEIFRRLARAMGFDDPELAEGDAALIERVLRETGAGCDFEELRRRGWLTLGDSPRIFWADGRFPTRSGRIEIASATAEASGLPRVPRPTVEARPAAGRFRLLSPASDTTLNSSFGSDPRLRGRAGPARVQLHPDDARHLGVASGDRVRLCNEEGALELDVEVAEVAPPGVVVSYKGRWPSREPSGANVNVLDPGRKSDMGESTSLHSTEVRVERL